MFNQIRVIGASALLGLVGVGTAFAADPVVSGHQISVQSQTNLSNVTLSVSGPNGFSAQEFSKSGTPSLALVTNGTLADGVYTWQISGATNQMVSVAKNALDNGRGEDARAFVNKSSIESGTFRVQGGSIVMPGGQVEEPLIRRTTTILQEQ